MSGAKKISKKDSDAVLVKLEKSYEKKIAIKSELEKGTSGKAIEKKYGIRFAKPL